MSAQIPLRGASVNPSLGKGVELPTNQASEIGRIQREVFNSVAPSSVPECWKRMLRYIDLYSTVPETKNVAKKVSFYQGHFSVHPLSRWSLSLSLEIICRHLSPLLGSGNF